MPISMPSRSFESVRAILMERSVNHRNPMEHVPPERAEEVFDELGTLDRDSWARAFSDAAEPYFAAGLSAERTGRYEEARERFLEAYGLFRVARYPAPNSPQKAFAYRRSQEAYLKAAAYFKAPITVVRMAYHGAQAPGKFIVGYLQTPADSPPLHPLPLVVQWGGIDSFKEDRKADPYLAAGWAVLAIDMPGVGDAPIVGSETGEELWNGVLDWAQASPLIDSARIAVVGSSTGGYWATKLAHTHRDRLAAAVNHGGPAHFAFEREWIYRAQDGEYPFELAETLASAFGLETAEQWVAYAPRLSLRDQGVLNLDSTPLLCVNGVDDSIFPIDDHYLLLQHGRPKSARFFPGGHMGHSPEVFPTITRWLDEQFRSASG